MKDGSTDLNASIESDDSSVEALPKEVQLSMNSEASVKSSSSCSQIAPSEDANGNSTNGKVAEKATTYVYAIGEIEARFPTMSIEKEFAQASGRSDTSGLTDNQLMYEVLKKPENRYLRRNLCWVMKVQGIETYIVLPRYAQDYELLVETLPSNPDKKEVDVVIGTLGPVAKPQMCNGLQVPIVVVDQLYSFRLEEHAQAIPRPDNFKAKDFDPAAMELFSRVMQITDNAGATDEHRALNYVAMRYPAIYELAMNMYGNENSLASIETRPSRLSQGTRKILGVKFSFRNRKTDVLTQYFTRVDVSGEFPFLVSKLAEGFEN